MVESVNLSAQFRVMLTTARGPRTWFETQLDAIRNTGAAFDVSAQAWVRWLDPAEPEHLATALTRMAAVARDYGATLTVTPGAEVIGEP